MWRLPVCLFSRLLKKDGSGSVECTARQSVSQWACCSSYCSKPWRPVTWLGLKRLFPPMWRRSPCTHERLMLHVGLSDYFFTGQLIDNSVFALFHLGVKVAVSLSFSVSLSVKDSAFKHFVFVYLRHFFILNHPSPTPLFNIFPNRYIFVVHDYYLPPLFD